MFYTYTIRLPNPYVFLFLMSLLYMYVRIVCPKYSPEHKVVENYLVHRHVLFYGYYLLTD